ncbi:stimulus-sensing domain-containing protein [Rubrimonas cliftonensis]|uniref:histidine kinase n=1 Tax=Rubrimonas cliftonensis TaxID=89524 RepID=A0A1H3VRN7_9RHOB|nr:stimulus-sensing domain-containing protein [Rubrimonas cliftonensis]SDZ76904.1 two-component system, OmpR family, sensor histidine kinase ChvG [Rubrimonas cliftonensis]
MRDLPDDATPPEGATGRNDGRAGGASLLGGGSRAIGALARAWVFSPVSSLTRRIVFINLIGLGLLVAGVLFLNQFRAGLIDLRTQALRTQGEIIAAAIALVETSGEDGALTEYNPDKANVLLRRLAQPAGVRARIFDRSGRLTGDTRSFSAPAAPIAIEPLPPQGEGPDLGLLNRLERIYKMATSWLVDRPELYQETAIAGITTEAEVYEALRGEGVTAVRANSAGELIVSVAIPIQRFKAVLGALVLSTEGGDIDAIVRAERIAILRVFLVALGVSVVLSLLLAGAIAKPLRRLAAAAERSGALDSRSLDLSRVSFPDLTRRADEIGHLSGALREMTTALYGRIEGIEQFAADVAHEIKNPLTSLRSAVETLRRARTPEVQERLLKVIEHDVRRLDRLVTDISNASRLDAEMVREQMEPVDLKALLGAVAEVAEVAQRRSGRSAGVRVMVSAPPLIVMGLDSRLGQVFANLVDNAISFSPPGGAVRVRARPFSGGMVRVSVEDSGPGVPADSLEAIFRRFYSDRPGHEAYGDHSGLGLSISRQIVTAHRGRIWAENIEGPGGPVGARFVVELRGG